MGDGLSIIYYVGKKTEGSKFAMLEPVLDVASPKNNNEENKVRLMVQNTGKTDQLRLAVYPMIYRIFSNDMLFHRIGSLGCL